MPTRPARRSVALVLASVILCGLPAPARAGADGTPPPQPPDNIRIGPALEPAVALLLRRSPAFRQQCARIAAARFARVTIVATPAPRELLAPRARSVITRHVHGALRAIVEVPLTPDVAELIGHELEHVIEQIEGLNLPALALRGEGGVVEVQRGVFETARAQKAGRTIADEAAGGGAAFRAAGGAMPRIRVTRHPAAAASPWRR